MISALVSRLVAPKRHRPWRSSAPYECGIVPGRDPPERFPVRFYLVAMIFIVFDIEIIFLYPWAVIYRELGASGSAEMVLFAVAVFVSFVYLIEQRRPRLGPGQADAGASADGHRRRRTTGRSHHQGAARGRDGGRGPTEGERASHLKSSARPEGLEGLDHNFLTGTLEGLVKWARRKSVFPATFGLACCAIEMMATGGPHYDLARYGMEVFRASPARPT